MTVNGESVTREVEGRMLLVHFLRDELGLTGTHWGCDTSNCGTCVTWMDDEPVKSCTVLAAMAGGREVRTVEDLERDGVLDPVQEGFMRCHGLQCGFCTPGMLMTARALLDRNPHPDEAEIREAISGQICRCTGYTTIVRSILWAADHPDGPDGCRARAGQPRPRGARHDRSSRRSPRTSRTPTTTRSRSATAGCCARRTRASSAAWAATSTTCSSRGCCTSRSCARRSRTPTSSASTSAPRRPTRR